MVTRLQTQGIVTIASRGNGPDEPLENKRLGFGCAGLMNRLDRRGSLALIEAAFDAGITHFDTAPLYGYGEAEGVLGEFLAARRRQVTVTTKVGILPPAASTTLALAKSVARRIAGLHPALRRELQRRAIRMVSSGVFETDLMQASLERSLRALRTDHIDLLLLHEVRPPDVIRDDVLAFLERAKESGKIGAYGLATDIETTRAAVSARNPLSQVIQFADSIFDRNLDHVAAPDSSLIIAHSVLGLGYARLQDALAQDPRLLRQWTAALGFDVRDRDQLGRLLLSVALLRNPRGIVLFSSRSTARIAQNAMVLSKPPSTAMVRTLEQLALAWVHKQQMPAA